METKSTRKRRRTPGGDGATESEVNEDQIKPYSIRSRRTHARTTSSDESVSTGDNEPKPSSRAAASTNVDKEGPSPVNQARNTTNSTLIATRELHTQIMNRVRDLTPSIPKLPQSNKPTAPTTPSTSKPNSPRTSEPSSSDSNATNTSDVSSKNTTRTVKELQHLISQYVQRKRANMATASPASSTSPINNNNPINNSKTSPNSSGISHAPPAQRVPSSIFANKFSNAINKLHSPNGVLHSSTADAPKFQNLGSHEVGKGSGHSVNTTTSTRSHSRPAVTSMLDNSVPVLSLQYQQKKGDKRQKLHTSESSSEANDTDNYFLLAAQHELQNMDEELLAMTFFDDVAGLEALEEEIEYLHRGIAMRDRVINKLHAELEEKNTISFPHPFLSYIIFDTTYLLNSLPYELVSNWIAASRIMMGQ